MIGNRISPRFPLAPKMSCPSGTPIASVFLTEQNRAAMKASLSSLAGLPAQATPFQGRGKRLKNSPGTCPITRAYVALNFSGSPEGSREHIGFFHFRESDPSARLMPGSKQVLLFWG